MLHIGHFSYDDLGENGAVRHGYFTCVVDADNPDGAAAMFAAHILEMKRSEYFFANVVKVYVEDIVKIPQPPDSPLVTMVQSCEGAFPRSISYSLPFDCPEGVDAYGMVSNVDRHEDQSGKAYVEPHPFIEFETPHRKKRKDS
jgi:hypothetical protein